MSLAQRLQDTLDRFEDKTEGVLGTSVISRSQALMMASTSNTFDEAIIQGMSVRFLKLAMDTLSQLVEEPELKSVSVEEDQYYIFIQTVNPDYFVVAVTDKSEFSGVRLSNLSMLIDQLKRTMEG